MLIQWCQADISAVDSAAADVSYVCWVSNEINVIILEWQGFIVCWKQCPYGPER